MQAGKTYRNIYAYLAEVNAPIPPEEAARAAVAEQRLFDTFVTGHLKACAAAACNMPARRTFAAPALVPEPAARSLAHPAGRLPDFDIF
ncbi:MAG: hypothetical protein IIZ93_11840 [Acidaminococcaceae bacterium]|nr:hypothetical protein [Acidaminococcaceae bacterium]